MAADKESRWNICYPEEAPFKWPENAEAYHGHTTALIVPSGAIDSCQTPTQTFVFFHMFWQFDPMPEFHFTKPARVIFW